LKVTCFKKTRQKGTHTGKRVEAEDAEDAEMKISERVSRKRKLMWMARFGAEIAKHNAPMIGRSQNIADCE
jgi:hypothetical protein